MMLKMRGKGLGGRELLVFVLSDANIEKLKTDDPVYFSLQHLGKDLPDLDISIAHGDNIDKVYQELQNFIRKEFE